MLRIAALYAIEADIRRQSAEDRRLARQQRSKPLVEAMQAWLAAQLNRVSGRSGLAQAMLVKAHWAAALINAPMASHTYGTYAVPAPAVDEKMLNVRVCASVAAAHAADAGSQP